MPFFGNRKAALTCSNTASSLKPLSWSFAGLEHMTGAMTGLKYLCLWCCGLYDPKKAPVVAADKPAVKEVRARSAAHIPALERFLFPMYYSIGTAKNGGHGDSQIIPQRTAPACSLQ